MEALLSNVGFDWNLIYAYIREFTLGFIKWFVVFLAFLLIAYVVEKLILRCIRNISDEKSTIIKLLANVSKVSIILLGLVTSLGSVDIDVSALVAGLGLTGFAVGFALKDTLSNILSGILVIIYQPFKVNQYIKISGHTGRVSSIDLRYTVLESDGIQILVPNTTVFTKEVIVSNTPLT